MKDEAVSAHRTQSPMHADEQAARPLGCLRGADRGAVETDVM